jgi:hypothetical protein
MTVTFEELAALAIDTDALPPMRDGRRNDGRRKQDRKRGGNAKRETLARRQATALKYAEAQA